MTGGTGRCRVEMTASTGVPAGSDSGSREWMYAALPALIAFLQREGRVSYRALAYVFNGDQAFRHPRSVNHVNTLAYALWHCGVWLPAILRETDALRCQGAELVELAREHRLMFWEAIASPFLLEGEEAGRR